MANRTGAGRNSSKKNIKNSVILNSEETMRKMDIFGDTLFGKEKEEENVADTMSFENTENENVTEKMEEIVPIQEEKIDDLDFENPEISETQSTLTEEGIKNNEIAQNFEENTMPEQEVQIEGNNSSTETAESVEDPSIEEVAIDDILSMIDEENEQEVKTEEPMGTMDLSSNIEQNSEEKIADETTSLDSNMENSNLSDFSSEILGNISNSEESTPVVEATAEIVSSDVVNTQGEMKIEDLLIGDTLLEMMQNADVDVTAIERTEGREALKMIGE